MDTPAPRPAGPVPEREPPTPYRDFSEASRARCLDWALRQAMERDSVWDSHNAARLVWAARLFGGAVEPFSVESVRRACRGMPLEAFNLLFSAAWSLLGTIRERGLPGEALVRLGLDFLEQVFRQHLHRGGERQGRVFFDSFCTLLALQMDPPYSSSFSVQSEPSTGVSSWSAKSMFSQILDVSCIQPSSSKVE